MAQPRGHDLPDGVQRPRRGLTDSGTGTRRDGGLERDGEGDGLVVVEQQRRQLGTGGEPAAPVGALDGHDGVAELPQPVDITAYGARADLQPLRQQLPRPVPTRLEQGEQGQQSR